jgi:hypothetical protein
MGCHKVSGSLNGQAVGLVGAVGSFGFGITSPVIPIRLELRRAEGFEQMP